MLLSAGQLDPFFGSNGIVTRGGFAGASGLSSIEVMPDGRILGLGSYSSGPAVHLFLTRLKVNGEIDPTFGGQTPAPPGVVLTDLAANDGQIKLLGSGKILVASHEYLRRLNSDGSVDPTFTPDQHTTYKFPFSIYGIDVQEDGAILLSGRYRQTQVKRGHFVVARLRANGTHDPGFGQHGIVELFPLSNSEATAVQAMPDGSIYIAGFRDRGYLTDLDEYHTQDALGVKLLANGTFDPAYGTAGVAMLTGRYFAGSSMTAVLGSDGAASITACGDDVRVIRITPQGARGSGSGILPGGVSYVHTTVQSDGALVMSSGSWTPENPPQRRDILRRLTPAGALDQAFGTKGAAPTPLSSRESLINDVTFANDGSILVAGRSGSKSLLARYWRDEAPAAQLSAANLKKAGTASHRFSIAVRDDVAVKAATINSATFRIIAPDGQSLRPSLMSLDSRLAPGLIGANFKLAAPGGSWGLEDNGVYRVRLLGGRLSDMAGNLSTARTLGSFIVRIPAALVPMQQAAGTVFARSKKIEGVDFLPSVELTLNIQSPAASL